MNHGMIMDYPFVSYDLVTQDGFSPWTHPPMFMSHDLEQLLNQSQQQMNWLWQHTSPPVPSQHSANKPVSYPYRVWKHFVARLTLTSNKHQSILISCHAPIAMESWGKSWVWPDWGSDSPRRLPSPWAPRPVASPASWPWINGQCQSSLRGDHFHRRKWYLATWYLIQLIGPSIFGW